MSVDPDTQLRDAHDQIPRTTHAAANPTETPTQSLLCKCNVILTKKATQVAKYGVPGSRERGRRRGREGEGEWGDDVR